MIISDGRKIKVQNFGLYPISANRVVLVKGKTVILAEPDDVNITKYPLAIALQPFEIGSWGEVVLSGSLLNVNTSVYSDFTNTILYLGAEGVITATPSNVSIGSISKLSNIEGEIFINFSVSPTVAWGDITGDIVDQTDLQDELNARVPYTGADHDVDLGEYELKAGQVEFDQTPTGTTGVAVMRWNNTDGTVDIGLKGGTVTLQVGQEEVVRVVNKTGANLLESQYKVVRVRTQAEGGAQGQRLAVLLAQSDSKLNHSGILGLVTENINNNQEGFVTSYGFVNNINTTGSLQGETWNDGDSLWLSATVAGGLTNVEPTTHPVQIGYVTYSHANNGKIFVRFGESADELDELHDVSITSPTNGQVLSYNSTSGLWVNSTPSTGSGTVTSIATTSPILGGTITTSGTISIQQADTSKDGYLSATDWNTFKNKQDAISLTTSGTSGPATLVGSTLNIPEYGSSGVSVYIKNFTTYTSVGAGSQILHSLLIPANTFTTGDILRFTARFSKSGTNTTSQTNIYVNSSVSTSGATVIKAAIYATASRASTLFASAVIINNTTETQLNWTATNLGPSETVISTSPWQSVAVDWTTDKYILFFCNPQADTNTVSLIHYLIEKL